MKQPKSFEEGMARLQELLDRLASPDTPLEEAVTLYTETAALAEYCTAALDKARLKMEAVDARIAALDKPRKESDEA